MYYSSFICHNLIDRKKTHTYIIMIILYGTNPIEKALKAKLSLVMVINTIRIQPYLGCRDLAFDLFGVLF